jgi:FkbM family methyltransferase
LVFGLPRKNLREIRCRLIFSLCLDLPIPVLEAKLSTLIRSALSSAAGFAQRKLGSRKTIVRLVVKLRNQCDMIIAANMAAASSPSGSGEEWLLSLVGGDVHYFVDVGANVGEWSLAMASLMKGRPEGLLFEPSPETAAALKAVLGSKGLTHLSVIQAAVGERGGSVRFYVEPNCGKTAGFFPDVHRPRAQSIDVPLIKLDDELSARNVPHVDFMKIDAEGNDFNVILGAENYISNHLISVVQFEYNSAWRLAGSTLARAFSFFQGRGYKVRLLKPGTIGELNVTKAGEFFNYANFVAYCPSRLGEIIDKQRHHLVL